MALPEDFVDAKIYPILDELRLCLCRALGDSVPCFCGIIVGDGIPVEHAGGCDDCGAAYVRLVNGFPSTTFPTPDLSATCVSTMTYTLAVGVVRCAPLGRNDGAPPSQEELEETARRGLADMDSIIRAIKCCFVGTFDDVDHVLGAYTPVPASSGVSGGEVQLIVSEPL